MPKVEGSGMFLRARGSGNGKSVGCGISREIVADRIRDVDGGCACSLWHTLRDVGCLSGWDPEL